MSDVSYIFDMPGPRGRRAVLAVTIVSSAAIAAAVALAIHRFYVTGQLDADRWSPYAQWPIIRLLLMGLWRTIVAAVAAAAIAVPLGVVLALGRLSNAHLTLPMGALHVPLRLRWLAITVIEFFRAVPLLLIVYVFFFALPRYGLNPSLFWKLVIPIGLCDGAVLAEVFRAGILALPKGQGEAAASLGLTGGQAFISVIFPQAVRMVVPSLVAQLVILLKDTTLGYAVSYAELQKTGQTLTSIMPNTYLQGYFIVAVIFVAINLGISSAARVLDRRMGSRTSGRTKEITQVA